MTLMLVIFLIHSGNGSVSSDEDDVVPPSVYERGTSRSGGATPSDTGVDVDGAFMSMGTRGVGHDSGKDILDNGEFLMGSNDNVELPFKWTVVTYPDNGSGRTKSLFLILHCLSGTTDGCLKVQICKDDLSTITIEHGTGQVETLWYRNSGLYDDCIPSVQEQFSLVDSSLTENYNNVPKQVQTIKFPFQLRHIVKVDMSSQPFVVVNHHGFEQEEIFTTAIIEAKIAWDDMDRIKTSTVRRKAAILSPRAHYMDGIGRVATSIHTGDESIKKPYTNMASNSSSNAGIRQGTKQEETVKDSHDALSKILEEKIAEAVAKLQLVDQRSQHNPPIGNFEVEPNEVPVEVSTSTSTTPAVNRSSASSARKKPMMRIKTPSSRTSATAEESEDEYNGKIVSYSNRRNAGTADDEDISYAPE